MWKRSITKVIEQNKPVKKPPSFKAVVETVKEQLKVSTCKDSRGNVYDYRELRGKRNKVIKKGMTFLYKFLVSKNCAPLYEIGDDGPSVFFEIWYTSADSSIRCRAKAMAKHLLDKLQEQRFAKKEVKECGRDDFFEYMFMLRCRHGMGMDFDALLKRSDAVYKKLALEDTDELYGYKLSELDKVSTDAWLMLVMRVMCMDYNNVMFRKRWRTRWGLTECFKALREHTLKFYDHDGLYLATHIVFAISAYSSVKTELKDCPWLYKYCRLSLQHWLKQIRRQEKLGDPKVFVDIDAVAECCDVLRGLGRTEASDPLLCEGSVWMVKQQLKNGSFPVLFPDDPDGQLYQTGQLKRDAYDKMHSTWVCTQSLRDRDFRIRENLQWLEYIRCVLRDSAFTTVTYKASWSLKASAAVVRAKEKEERADRRRLLGPEESTGEDICLDVEESDADLAEALEDVDVEAREDGIDFSGSDDEEGAGKENIEGLVAGLNPVVLDE